MHEMALFASVTRIIAEEMKRHGLTRLTRVTLKCGVLAGLSPYAMRFAWSVHTETGPLAGAKLIVEETPLRLRCGACEISFEPRRPTIFAVCPCCGLDVGHEVLSGRELYIESLEGDAVEAAQPQKEAAA